MAAPTHVILHRGLSRTVVVYMGDRYGDSLNLAITELYPVDALAIDHLVKVIRVADIGGFQRTISLLPVRVIRAVLSLKRPPAICPGKLLG